MDMIEQFLKQHRAIVMTSLALLTLLSWGWVLFGAGTGMSTLAITTFQLL